MKFSPITQDFITSAIKSKKKKRTKGAGWNKLLGELKNLKLKRSGSQAPAFSAEYSGPPVVIRAKKIKESKMSGWIIPVVGAAALALILLKKRK